MKKTLFVCVVVLSVLLALPVIAGAATINVPAQHATIQAAINAAAAGDTIQVAAGNYPESLSINKSLTILGPNASISPNGGTRVAEAVLAPTTAADAFLANASNITVTVKGMTIDGTNAKNGCQGFYASGKNNSTWTFEHNIHRRLNGYWYASWWITGSGTTNFAFNLRDNLFTDHTASNGIMVDSGAIVTADIRDNLWDDNEGYALNVNRLRGTIANNTFRDAKSDGLQWYQYQLGLLIANSGTDLEVYDNIFDKVAHGIIVYDGNEAVFDGVLDVHDNVFDGARINAFRVRGSGTAARPDLSEVTVTNNAFTGGSKISVGNASDALVAEGNWFGQNSGPAEGQIEGPGTVDYDPWIGKSSGTSGAGSVPAGSDVDVEIGDTGIAVNFSEVTGAGYLLVKEDSSPAAPPSSFAVGSTIFNITPVGLTFTGPILVTLPYDPDAFGAISSPKMFHYEDGRWKDVTVSVDTTNHTVTGRVTSFSPFMVGALSGGAVSTSASSSWSIMLSMVAALIVGIYLVRRQRLAV